MYHEDIKSCCSFYYTVCPPLFSQAERNNKYSLFYFKRLCVECERCQNGKIKVRRILSSDPMDYIKNSGIIGEELDAKLFSDW